MNFQNLLDYCKWKEIDVFEGCTVPDPFDIELVKDNIMKRCGLLRPIYAEPEVFQALTKMWFDSNQWNFEHLAKIVEANYSPIENVYESDHWETKHSGTDKRALGGSDSNQASGTDISQDSGSDVNQASGTDTVTNGTWTQHDVYGYNSGNPSPSSKDSNNGDIDTDYGKKDTFTHGLRNDFTHGKKDTIRYGKTDDFTHGHIEEYTRLRHGNIGVTTNNQLITEEYEMLNKFNAYDWIAAKFERENFLQLY